MNQPTMPKLRVLAGTLLLLVFVIVYVLLAMVVANTALPQIGQFGSFVYYAAAGLAWVPVAGLIIKWMYAR